MLVAEWPDRSNRMIADALGCDEKTIRNHRSSISTAESSAVEMRIGRDGKKRPAKRSTKSGATKALPQRTEKTKIPK